MRGLQDERILKSGHSAAAAEQRRNTILQLIKEEVRIVQFPSNEKQL
jgi:hypothetical protein